jgi:hypothetical protein
MPRVVAHAATSSSLAASMLAGQTAAKRKAGGCRRSATVLDWCSPLLPRGRVVP